MTSERFAARITFPIEAIDFASFRAYYEQTRPFGDEEIDAQLGEVTFLHPATPGGRFDSLERLLIDFGLPYNLYCDTPEEVERLHYWRPGMKATASTDARAAAAFKNPNFILSIRRACEQLVNGHTNLALGR